MKNINENANRRKYYYVFLLCSMIILSIISLFRYDWKMRVRADLLTKGYLFPEIRTEIDKDELANRSISEFVVCLVYSDKQYIGYVNRNLQFISSVNKSKLISEINHAKHRGICEIGLYFGQIVSAIFVILFSFLLIKSK